MEVLWEVQEETDFLMYLVKGQVCQDIAEYKRAQPEVKIPIHLDSNHTNMVVEESVEELAVV